MRRGEIYYVKNNNPLGGALIAGNRPAIIVSNNKTNDYSPAIEVVYLTGSAKFDLPTHVTINSTGKSSIALCESVYTIDKRDVETFVCMCTAREMELVDIALKISLGINDGDPTEGCGVNNHRFGGCDQTDDTPPTTVDTEALIRVTSERDVYKKMYEELLVKVLA